MGAIPASTFAYLIISLVICVFGPIAFLVIIGRKMPLRARIMLTGVILFIVFALLLERFVHSIVLKEGSPVMTVTAYYVIYGCLMAAVFEGAAKFVGLKYMVKEPTSPGFALQFGVGYGIAEAAILGVLPLASNLATAFQINKLGYDKCIETLTEQGADAATIEAFESNMSMLYENNLTCLLGGVERVAAVIMQIALTMIIFQAVKEGAGKKNYIYLLLAVVLHALFDMPAALYQKEAISNVFVTEVIILIEAVIAAVIAYLLYRKNVEEFGKPVNPQSEYNA